VSGNVNQKATRVQGIAAVPLMGAMGPNQAAGPHEFHAAHIEIRVFSDFPGRDMALKDEDTSKKEPRG
ncbi:MAG: hypothetical protein R6X27_04700, partial [Candidatus Desulfacyla sp.]